MTELEIYNEIENSKTKEWESPADHITDNEKILSVAVEIADLARNNGSEPYIGVLPFKKYLNQTLTASKKRWHEVVNHDYLKVIVDIKELGCVIIYEDVKGFICLDLIQSTKKGNGTILMNMFLDAIDKYGLDAVTLPACIDPAESIKANSEKGYYHIIWKRTMGLKRWSMEFNFKPCKKTPKLYYKS